MRCSSPVEAQTASLSSLAGLKAIFFEALILIGSPVCGLRPVRAARLRTCRMPRPVTLAFSPETFTGFFSAPGAVAFAGFFAAFAAALGAADFGAEALLAGAFLVVV